jgi:hypothetical protein
LDARSLSPVFDGLDWWIGEARTATSMTEPRRDDPTQMAPLDRLTNRHAVAILAFVVVVVMLVGAPWALSFSLLLACLLGLPLIAARPLYRATVSGSNTRRRLMCGLGALASSALILLGAIWPSPYTIAALVSLPAPVLWLVAMVRPPWLAERPLVGHYLAWSLGTALLCFAFQAVWLM